MSAENRLETTPSNLEQARQIFTSILPQMVHETEELRLAGVESPSLYQHAADIASQAADHCLFYLCHTENEATMTQLLAGYAHLRLIAASSLQGLAVHGNVNQVRQKELLTSAKSQLARLSRFMPILNSIYHTLDGSPFCFAVEIERAIARNYQRLPASTELEKTNNLSCAQVALKKAIKNGHDLMNQLRPQENQTPYLGAASATGVATQELALLFYQQNQEIGIAHPSQRIINLCQEGVDLVFSTWTSPTTLNADRFDAVLVRAVTLYQDLELPPRSLHWQHLTNYYAHLYPESQTIKDRLNARFAGTQPDAFPDHFTERLQAALGHQEETN